MTGGIKDNQKNCEQSKKLTRLSDVAKLAGVSPAIVSRVLNSDSSLVIKDETRRKVLDAIRELSYQPNYIARSLRTRKSAMIGLMVVDITNPFISEFIRGVQEIVRETGRFCFLCESRDDPCEEANLVREMYERQAEGIIIATLKMDDPIVTLIEQLNVKCVAATRTIPELTFPSLTFNNEKSIRLCMEHVLELGHKKIGYLVGHSQSYAGMTRIRMFKELLEKYQIPFNPQYVIQSNYFAQDGYTAMEKMLELEEKPTAVIACNDVVAISAIKAAQTYGYVIPDDISIIGYNNIEVAAMVNPALTTIDTHVYEMGRKAAEMMICYIEDKPIEPLHVVMDTELIIRNSTGLVKGE